MVNQKLVLKDNNVETIMPKINKILEVYLFLDERLVVMTVVIKLSGPRAF